MHPLQIVYSSFETIRNSFLVIVLFVINWNNPSLFFAYGKWAFLIFLFVSFIYMIFSWFVTTYEFKDHTVHMYSGVFRKKHSSIPLDRVQNIQRSTPFYFKLFHVTSLTLETGISDEGASMKFEAVTIDEAENIEQYVDDYREQVKEDEKVTGHLDLQSEFESNESEDTVESTPAERTIHFNPTKKEIFKASFLSFSFLAFIPVVMTAYFKVEDVIDIEEKAQGFLAFLTSSWTITALAIIILICFAFIFGIIHAYLKYGKYEIASDDGRIYIRRGVLNERSFSIQKSRVQAVQINQPVLKKVLGIAEVRLISASTGIGETEEISSLYPFLPIDRAHSILTEILPEFPIIEKMEKLPKKSLYVKMLRPPVLFLSALLFVIFVKPAWWLGLPVIFIATYLMRFFQYRNTRYAMEGSYIQFKIGGLSSTLFITTRQKVTEVSVNRSLLQNKFGLASIFTYNRTTIFHIEELADIPQETSEQFIHWYADRHEEIELEQI